MRKIATYLMAILLPLSSLFATELDSDKFLDAVAQYAEGHYSSALVLLTELLETSPDDDAVNYYMGLCELPLNKVQEATLHLEKAASIDSTNQWYTNALVNLYGATGNRIKFADSCEKLVRLNPGMYSNPYTLTIIGDARLAQGRDSAALEKYNQALEIDPSYIHARLGKIEVFRMTGKMPSMFTELSKLVEDKDVDVDTKTTYLEAIMKNMDSKFYWVWGKTLEEIVFKCVEVHPSDVKANLLKFNMISITGDNDAMLSQCAVLAKVAETAGDKENLATAYAYEGDIAHSMGNNKRAYRAYDKALQIDPDHSSVLNNYAYFLSEEHRSLKKALKMSRRAVELEPDNATYLDTLGWILYLLHKPEEAKPYFKHAMIYGGKDSAVVLEHYSKVLKALGEDTLASYYESLAEQKKQ